LLLCRFLKAILMADIANLNTTDKMAFYMHVQ